MQRIFAGDVQGCAAELDDLIARARADFGGNFELWLVGDLVNRGPSNLRALERVRALADAGRARAVLGNHELALLRVALGLRALALDDSFRDVLEAGGDWLDWLRALPLVEAGQQGEQRFAMLHAASAPGWSLEELCERARCAQLRLSASNEDARELLAHSPRADGDADALARITRCRSVDARGRWSSREPALAEDAWHRRWLAGDPEFAIVYGHWATQGLHVAPLLRGLDTGCVYNGTWGERSLTAWLPKADGRPFDVPDDRFWRVPARGHYVAAMKSEESA